MTRTYINSRGLRGYFSNPLRMSRNVRTVSSADYAYRSRLKITPRNPVNPAGSPATLASRWMQFAHDVVSDSPKHPPGVSMSPRAQNVDPDTGDFPEASDGSIKIIASTRRSDGHSRHSKRELSSGLQPPRNDGVLPSFLSFRTPLSNRIRCSSDTS
jgi:hypothetical protein